ncbi:MAG: GtrA family protein [Bacteroidales bacterium]|jgi:putative flippase GtrA|nr:GtrA family protein [Bacteroidales bacterium]
MRKFLQKTGDAIRKFVDFFYPPFKKIMPIEFFRYGVTGAANLLFDWVLFFCFFHFVLQKEMLHLGFVTLSSHIAALALTFPISFLSGFLLQKYVTFTTSHLAGKKQIVRYALVVVLNLLINYFGLKLFVDGFGWFPTPSKMLITTVAVCVSYVSQKKFTFK